MIVPSKNQKTYGVIHTENYFSFLGFCKKVNSDKIQKVDIFLNDSLIDTIVANKHIEKVEDIYELEGFGFNYVLPYEYIGQKNLISFKNQETQENLQNSPYELINETHPKFNEMAFLNSLNNPIDEEKIKILYCQNSIGFFATKENLENENFVAYIKNLYRRLSNIKFKVFYFNEEEKNKVLLTFSEEMNKLEFFIPKNIYDIAKEIEIFTSLDNLSTSFIKSLFNYNQQIILIIYPDTADILNKKLNELLSVNHKEYEALREIGISDESIKKCNQIWVLSLWYDFFVINKINYELNENSLLSEYIIDILELCLCHKICKKHIIKAVFIYYKIHSILGKH